MPNTFRLSALNLNFVLNFISLFRSGSYSFSEGDSGNPLLNTSSEFSTPTKSCETSLNNEENIMVDGETEEELSDNYRFVLSYNTDNEKPCYCKAEKQCIRKWSTSETTTILILIVYIALS